MAFSPARHPTLSPARYDHLLATRDVGVDWVAHVAHDAFAAGSDHALVHGEFSLS